MLWCGLQVTTETAIRLEVVFNFLVYTHLYSTLQLLLARQPLLEAFRSIIWHIMVHAGWACALLCAFQEIGILLLIASAFIA